MMILGFLGFRGCVTPHQGCIGSCLNQAGGGVAVSRDLSIPMAVRKASAGILHWFLAVIYKKDVD